jgi:hypothetical protein
VERLAGVRADVDGEGARVESLLFGCHRTAPR